jgi:hypothetical protein
MLLLVSLFLVHAAFALASFEGSGYRVQRRRAKQMAEKGRPVDINQQFLVFSLFSF